MSYILIGNNDGTSSLVHTDEDNSYLAHHGIKGQRWGVRRFQNPDGSLKPMGKSRYTKVLDKLDDERAAYRSRYIKNDYKASKINVKQKKYEAKYNANKTARNKAKMDSAKNKRDRLLKENKDIRKKYGENENLANKIVANAEKQGYKVFSRNVMKGKNPNSISAIRDRAKYGPRFANTAVNSMGERVMVYETPSQIVGKKYKLFVQ